MTRAKNNQPHQPIGKQCLACKKKFLPDPRVGQRQQYCSNKECQSMRQHLNEQSWLNDKKNQKFRSAQQRRWRKRHPGHLKQWRKEHPQSVEGNREFMREYQRRKRQDQLFEKSKEWRLQIAKDKGVIYTSRGNTWFLTRLKRAGRLSKALGIGYAYERIQAGSVRLPQGRLYQVSAAP